MINRTSGALAERAAERWLCSRGLEPLARNYRCRAGEIDLVMRDGATLVFVEVRLRNHSGFGSGADSVTASKRARLVRAATHFMLFYRDLGQAPCRFDVMAGRRTAAGSIDWEWLQHAFDASY
ncbi:MAG: YraN family protein [Spongiibacteraceae bacterium]|nr:YraN family protein [Spongiibacteraceae bacterium]